MKRKFVAALLLVLGIILICVAAILSVISVNDKDVIGGADLYTLVFVFFRQHSGIYFLLAAFGIISIVVSVIIRIFKRK